MGIHFQSSVNTVMARFIGYFSVRSRTVIDSTCHELSWSITHSELTATLTN